MSQNTDLALYYTREQVDTKLAGVMAGLPVYANNAAAISGGLSSGAFYRTGADPDFVAVVH